MLAMSASFVHTYTEQLNKVYRHRVIICLHVLAMVGNREAVDITAKGATKINHIAIAKDDPSS